MGQNMAGLLSTPGGAAEEPQETPLQNKTPKSPIAALKTAEMKRIELIESNNQTKIRLKIIACIKSSIDQQQMWQESVELKTPPN